MRKIIFITLSITFLSYQAKAQFELTKVDSLQIKADVFTVDAIGYIYSAQKDIIEKRDTSFRLLFRQSVKITGSITAIDVVNPLKPLLFFLPQQSILFIDNTLTPYQDVLSLSDLGLSYATLICYSEQYNRYWIYDQDNSQLILFDVDGKRIRESENLGGLIGVVNPVQLLERNGVLFLVDEDRGVYMFDMFGTLIDFYPIDGVKWIQADAMNFYYIEDHQLYSRSIKLGTDFKVDVSRVYDKSFRMSRNTLYFKKDDQIDVFEINLQKKVR